VGEPVVKLVINNTFVQRSPSNRRPIGLKDKRDGIPSDVGDGEADTLLRRPASQKAKVGEENKTRRRSSIFDHLAHQ